MAGSNIITNLKYSVLSLNVKGLRNPIKRQKIINWIKNQNGLNGITFLQETHSDISIVTIGRPNGMVICFLHMEQNIALRLQY